jgi:hypothetical protein
MQSKQVTQAPVLNRNEIFFRAMLIMIMLTTFVLAHSFLMLWLSPKRMMPL